MRTIALEEHFWTPELAAAPGTGPLAQPGGQQLDAALRDLDKARIADMDAAGIDVQVVSHAQPAAVVLLSGEPTAGRDPRSGEARASRAVTTGFLRRYWLLTRGRSPTVREGAKAARAKSAVAFAKSNLPNCSRASSAHDQATLITFS